MKDESRQWIEGASRGDAVAIEALLQRHLPVLHAFIRLRAGALIRAKESCADLVQSVCREVLQDLSQFEYRGEAEFRGWLFQQALRKVVDRARFHGQERRDARHEVRMPTEMRDGEAAGLYGAYEKVSSPSRELMAREEIARIERAFHELPERQSEVVTLIRLAGLSYAETAAQTGQSVGAVRGLMRRGMARLARLLADS